MAQFFYKLFTRFLKNLAALKTWWIGQLMRASVPETFALCLMFLTTMAVYEYWGKPLLVVLCVVIGNTLVQMSIDYFPSNIKPGFAAISRLVPAIAAVIAYLLSRTA